MNTLEDLRASLNQRADQLHDDDLYTRPAAVHGRIRAVRRRRTAVAAVAAVAAVTLVVGGVTGVGALRQPATPQPAVAGIDVPSRVTINSYPYSFDERGVDPQLRQRLAGLALDSADGDAE